jgi:hypothetical protein
VQRNDAMGHEQSFRVLAVGSAVVARQSDDELGKYAGLGLDVDSAAVLLDNDVMGHREPEPCPFPGRFGGKEGIEHFFFHFGWDAAPVVANSDFDCLAEVPGRGAEDRLKGLVDRFDLAPGCGIEAVGN